MKRIRRHRRTDCGSFIVDDRGTVLGFDEGMESLTGWPAIEVVGRHKDMVGSFRPHGSAAQPLSSGPMYDGAIPMVPGASRISMNLHCRDGRLLHVEAVVTRMTGAGSRAQVTILRSLARSADGQEPLVGDRRDALTGLQDREAFCHQLADDMSASSGSGRPLALILADVDHLRELNDRWGRAAGDALLRQIAGVLRVTIDDERRIYRLGDDDFAVLLPDSGRGDARQVAATLRSTVERFRFAIHEEGAPPVHLTLSLGAASFPTDADNPRDLIERVQEALNEARSLGRNRVWCYVRRPRVPVQVPVFFDGADAQLLGYTRDLSPSGIFVATSTPIDLGMRCALAFPLPGQERKVHVIGRIVRTVPADGSAVCAEARVPGMGVEFEQFGGASDRRAIDAFVHGEHSGA